MGLIFHQLCPGTEIAEIAKRAHIDIESASRTSQDFTDLRIAIEKAYEGIKDDLQTEINMLKQRDAGIHAALQTEIEDLTRKEEGKPYDILAQQDKEVALFSRIFQYRARASQTIIPIIAQRIQSLNSAGGLFKAAPAPPTKKDNILKLVHYLSGNYATQIIDIGLRAGLFQAIKARSISDHDLAQQLGFVPSYVEWWCKAAYAFELLERDQEGKYNLHADMAPLLLEPTDLDFLGDEFLLSAALFQEFHDFPSYLYTGQIKSRNEIDPRVRKFYQNLTQDDAFVITHLVLPEVPNVLKRLQDDPTSQILDIGTGIGAALVYYANYFPEVQKVVGLDIDQPTVLLAKRMLEEMHNSPAFDDRIEIRSGDATDPNDLSDNELSHYDLVIINLALHEMGREYRKVVDRVCTGIKQGGAVVICDFFADSTPEEVAAYRELVYQQWLSLYLHQLLIGSSMISFQNLKELLERQSFNAPHVVGHPINGYLMVVAEKK